MAGHVEILGVSCHYATSAPRQSHHMKLRIPVREKMRKKSRTKIFMRGMEETKAKLSGKSFSTYLLKQEAMQELSRWWDILLECRLTRILLFLTYYWQWHRDEIGLLNGQFCPLSRVSHVISIFMCHTCACRTT